MDKILITGGLGYIGSVACSELLASGYSVYCLDNFLNSSKNVINKIRKKNFQFIECDINDFQEVETVFEKYEFNAVIHLAAIVGDPACKENSNLAIKTNWDASKNLIECAIRCKVKKFIFASTCSNYGKMDSSDAILNEEAKLSPLSLYAELKVRFEQFILDELNRSSSIIPTILRFGTVYGLSPRMRFDLTINEFCKELYLGRELTVFGEQFWRPYCHVEDFSNAFRLILESPENKVAYNVFNVGCSSENYTKKMIIDEISNIMNDCKIKYILQQDDPRDYRVDFTKIKKTLGFKISKKVPLGINEIISALKDGQFSDCDSQKYYNIDVNK